MHSLSALREYIIYANLLRCYVTWINTIKQTRAITGVLTDGVAVHFVMQKMWAFFYLGFSVCKISLNVHAINGKLP